MRCGNGMASVLSCCLPSSAAVWQLAATMIMSKLDVFLPRAVSRQGWRVRRELSISLPQEGGL